MFRWLVLATVALGLAATCGVVVSDLRRGNPSSSWRTRFQVGACCLAAASALLYLGTVLYSRIIGGFPFYDPTLMAIYLLGALTALVGLLIGTLGRGRARVAVMGLSGSMLTLWLATASSE